VFKGLEETVWMVAGELSEVQELFGCEVSFLDWPFTLIRAEKSDREKP